MPRSLPQLAELLPPVDGRSFSRQEWSELRAVRLALVMVTAVLHQGDFLFHHRPIPGGHDNDLRWLHEHLEPLATVSPTVRKLRRLFDLKLYGRAWADPTQVRHNLKVLSQEAHVLAQVMAAPPATPSPRRNRGR
jgi:hypothetical protein